MNLEWTSKASGDLARLYEFLAVVNQPAAARVVQTLAIAAERLLQNPYIGERLCQFEAREVRRVIVNTYEIRYEILGDTLYILRLWHTRESR